MLYGLVTRVVEHAQTAGLAQKAGMIPTGDSAGWGRYFQFEGFNVWLGVKFTLWARQADTPVWFRFQSSSQERFQEVRNSYRGWEIESPPRLMYDDHDVPSFPMYLENGLDRDQLVLAIVDQIISIVAPLKRVS